MKIGEWSVSYLIVSLVYHSKTFRPVLGGLRLRLSLGPGYR